MYMVKKERETNRSFLTARLRRARREASQASRLEETSIKTNGCKTPAAANFDLVLTEDFLTTFLISLAASIWVWRSPFISFSAKSCMRISFFWFQASSWSVVDGVEAAVFSSSCPIFFSLFSLCLNWRVSFAFYLMMMGPVWMPKQTLTNKIDQKSRKFLRPQLLLYFTIEFYPFLTAQCPPLQKLHLLLCVLRHPPIIKTRRMLLMVLYYYNKITMTLDLLSSLDFVLRMFSTITGLLRDNIKIFKNVKSISCQQPVNQQTWNGFNITKNWDLLPKF